MLVSIILNKIGIVDLSVQFFAVYFIMTYGELKKIKGPM